MDDQERRKLVQRAVTGDADALQRLILVNHAKLRAVVQRAIGARMRRRVDADDVLQAAYAVAIRTASACTFEEPGAFYGWLKRITLNQLKDHQRALRRQKTRCRP